MMLDERHSAWSGIERMCDHVDETSLDAYFYAYLKREGITYVPSAFCMLLPESF